MSIEKSRSKVQGIYILANDNVIEDTIAFLHSLRQYAPDYPVILIPYDDRYQRAARLLHDEFGVEVFEDQHLFDVLDEYARAIRGKSAPMYRKFACWFGPFDQFIYFDTDIVVFQDQKDVFDLLSEHDIVYCGSGRALGIETVFTERVLERNLFSKQEIDDLFNAGFFASKKEALDYAQLISVLEDATAIADVFLPESQDQTVLNYLVLRSMPKRANLRELAPAVTSDAWAGVPMLRIRKGKLYKRDGTPVRHIHWASFNRTANRPYVSLWLRYRYPGRSGAVQRLALGFRFLLWRIMRRLFRIGAKVVRMPDIVSSVRRRISSRILLGKYG